MHEPLLMYGPAPSTCCRTLKARASPLPDAADWLTTIEWTRLLVLGRRISPGRRQNRWEREWMWYHKCLSCPNPQRNVRLSWSFYAKLTSTILNLGSSGAWPAADVQELLPNLLQYHVVHTWTKTFSELMTYHLWRQYYLLLFTIKKNICNHLPSPTRAIRALVKLFWTNWCS